MDKCKSFLKKVGKFLYKPVDWFIAFKKYLAGKFFKIYPGKKSIDLGGVLLWGSTTFLGVLVIMSLVSSPEEDGSSYNTSYASGSEEGEDTSLPDDGNTGEGVKGVGRRNGKRLSGSDPTGSRRRGTKIKYSGKQVLVRANSQGDRALPVGTNFVGKLLSTVDTRHSDKFVRVLLPFGGKFKDRVGLPKNTVLLGQVNYPGLGKRVFIQFHTGILPSGDEIKIEASAMDAKDFSPGLIGSYHSAFGNRAGATLGFAFVSGASDVLQDREALGEGFNQTVTKKPTIKNAMLNGISEFSKTEGAFQLQEAQSEGAYVTLNQGRELIITLTKTFKKGGVSPQ